MNYSSVLPSFLVLQISFNMGRNVYMNYISLWKQLSGFQLADKKVGPNGSLIF
uniref:Uncharacterized protein n=1 Tax=Anguilla anguilla TaxID=7936 RepID=A0A0E9X1E2_ANGAN